MHQCKKKNNNSYIGDKRIRNLIHACNIMWKLSCKDCFTWFLHKLSIKLTDNFLTISKTTWNLEISDNLMKLSETIFQLAINWK